jgi:hypothetical protein
MRVSGTGFGAYKAVDIYFGTKDRALVSTNSKGAFSGIRVGCRRRRCPGLIGVTWSPISLVIIRALGEHGHTESWAPAAATSGSH